MDKTQLAELLLHACVNIELLGKLAGYYDLNDDYNYARLKNLNRRAANQARAYYERFIEFDLPEYYKKQVAAIPGAVDYLQETFSALGTDRASNGRYLAALHSLNFYFKLIIIGDLLERCSNEK